MGFYVCFDDSKVDPTYASADDAFLVCSSDKSLGPDDNPCVGDHVTGVSVMPKEYDEVLTYANLMGWGVGYDNAGQIILYTGTFKPEPSV